MAEAVLFATLDQWQHYGPRFWSKVERTDTCWLWQAGRGGRGYGSFRFKDRAHPAQRIAYVLTKGPVAAGLLVCHSCDNPVCVNPSHLFLGTHRDNTQDMMAKGRNRCGHASTPGSPKLTPEQVLAIRQLQYSGHSVTSLGKFYDVSHQTITRIWNRQTWRAL